MGPERALKSEPPRTRTWNLEIKSLKVLIPVRTGASWNLAYIKRSRRQSRNGMSVPYKRVLLGLQYGCSTLSIRKTVPVRRTRDADAWWG